ncbi:hypothetical protein ACLB2K_057077 [Fragaria x ananassa]
MQREVKAKVSYQQAYRTKKAALELLEASIREQYARLRNYGAELVRADPNTTVDIKCDFPHGDRLPVFKRMYVCLGALKIGFIIGCRPILGLDGCHLKSVYGGQLLTAVGLDANNVGGGLRNGGPQIEVVGSHGDKYVVNLQAQTCACRRWDLTGIPCKHASSVANFMRHAPEDYVDGCYMKNTYMAIYNNTIKPVNVWNCGQELMNPQSYPHSTQGSQEGQRKRGPRMQLSGMKLVTNTKRSGPLTKNEKRKKVELRAQNLKEKRDAKKEATARGSQARPARASTSVVAPVKARPAKASTSSAPAPPKTIPSSSKQATPSRSSNRIRENARGRGK